MPYIHKRPTRNDYKRLVNDRWKGVSNRTPSSNEECIKGFKLLYRKATGESWTGKIRITSGNRHNWCRYNRKSSSWVWNLNPSRSWKDLIHSVSHWANLLEGNHTYNQLYCERDLTTYALKRGFHQGNLAPKLEKVQ